MFREAAPVAQKRNDNYKRRSSLRRLSGAAAPCASNVAVWCGVGAGAREVAVEEGVCVVWPRVAWWGVVCGAG